MPETDPQDHITHLPSGRVHELGYSRYAYQPGERADTLVEGFFRLSPRARVVYDPLHGPRPVMFMASSVTGDWREHVVVARERGDLSWPAYLASERSRYKLEAAVYVAGLVAPIREAIGDAKFALAQRKRAEALAHG